MASTYTPLPMLITNSLIPRPLTNKPVLSPLASSMFAPGIDKIADSLHVEKNSVIGCQTGFVIMLGIGPLVLAPLSETFGRKPLYLSCFAVFTLLQVPTALSRSLPVLIALRTVTGFFGSESFWVSLLLSTNFWTMVLM